MITKEIITTKISHAKYLKSGKWKCKRSPTKAHHWIVESSTQRYVKGGMDWEETCKYCKKTRRQSVQFPGFGGKTDDRT